MPLYKKYATHSTLNAKRAFDPLQGSQYPPDVCGFGKRLLIYNPDDNKLEFRPLDDPRVAELSVPLEQVLSVLVPTETAKIVKAQQTSKAAGKEGKGKDAVLSKVDRQLENEAYREKCKKVLHYPYAVITKDKRIEVIAETYTVYKYSVKALNQLIKNQKLLKSLKGYLIREAAEGEERDSP
eukprot:TRINITY_DN4132_c0_g1_i9.p1 TRINITY_DN4132_c0_g1~~TRINITY_DN4132_c0_g1_i9.p1  ORF type:complete len:182 (+),score=61.77 TRINITY_DN4132_c0_g1_i9:185-730(+)